jgi:hypothetical protein
MNIELPLFNQSTTRRVFFNIDTGDIVSINLPSTSDEFLNCNFFDIEYDEISDIAAYPDQLIRRKVVYSTKTTSYVIQKKEVLEFNTKVSNSIYKIEPLENAQVIIVHNIKNKRWEVKLNTALTELIKDKEVMRRDVLFFSVTTKDNPNILYRTFVCRASDVITNGLVTFDFKYNEEVNKDKISVYTKRTFESYSYEVIE